MHGLTLADVAVEEGVSGSIPVAERPAAGPLFAKLTKGDAVIAPKLEPCGRAGRYNVARLMEQYGDARLPKLLYVLADCPKAKAASVYDRCKAVYGADSRWSTSSSLKAVLTRPAWYRPTLWRSRLSAA
jgi:hypothetical protein